jgi:energy-coupling factor transport system substrate-specific component
MRKTKDLVIAGLLATIMVVSKCALDGIPSVELVSLLIIVYALEFPKLALIAIYTYLLIYGALFGFGLWWFPQLYVWPALFFVVRAFRQANGVVVFALISALFGLFYGALYAISYVVVSGAAGAFAWWIAGIPFDVAHCVGNFFVVLLLLSPLRKAIARCKQLGIL